MRSQCFLKISQLIIEAQARNCPQASRLLCFLPLHAAILNIADRSLWRQDDVIRVTKITSSWLAEDDAAAQTVAGIALLVVPGHGRRRRAVHLPL
jgi:hypothetical protein